MADLFSDVHTVEALRAATPQLIKEVNTLLADIALVVAHAQKIVTIVESSVKT